ncbi:MAG: DUF2461 domain-containing protein [Acidobacteriaceae bacterium]
MTAPTRFTPETLRFLRGLKRNNRREWFEERRSIYEQSVKIPMLALIEQLNNGMLDYAPNHVRPAAKSLFRIYRDTRFSTDKKPYKTHQGAWWAHSALAKTSGAGYYLHVSDTEFVIAAGVYMPEKDQLVAIRRHLLEHYAEWKRLITGRALLRSFSVHDPMALVRPPRGFPPDHPAIEWIKWRQWGVTAHLPTEQALRPDLLRQIEKRFRLAAPLVDFLNAPLTRAEPRRAAKLNALF